MILKFLRKLTSIFSCSKQKYALKLDGIIDHNGQVVCVFSVNGDIAPLKLPLATAITSTNISYNLNPETILFLKDIECKVSKKTSQTKIISFERNNHYSVNIEDQMLLLPGSLICRDLKVLSLFDIQDIVYNIAYESTINDLAKTPSKPEITIEKPILLKVVK